jgi:hypothetical protein
MLTIPFEILHSLNANCRRSLSTLLILVAFIALQIGGKPSMGLFNFHQADPDAYIGTRIFVLCFYLYGHHETHQRTNT